MARLVLLPRDVRSSAKPGAHRARPGSGFPWNGISASQKAIDRNVMDEPSRLLNRELSWLDFNRRVLALAQEPAIPPP